MRLANRLPMHINELLKVAVTSGCVGPAPEGGQLPDDAGQRQPRRRVGGKAPRSAGHRGDGARALHARAPREVPPLAGSGPRLQRGGAGAVPRQRLPAARHRRPGAARDSHADQDHRRARPAAGAQAHRLGRARPGAGDRHHRQRQEHDAGGDDRLHQRDARGAHHDGRGSDRVPAPRPPLARQPARGRGRHAVVLARAAQRPAPGSRRHPGRRDARLRDRRNRAPRRGNRPPGVLDAAHARRDRDHQPDHRGVSAAPAAPGQDSAGVGAEGGDLAAAAAARRRRRPRRRRSR